LSNKTAGVMWMSSGSSAPIPARPGERIRRPRSTAPW
jgi:hypothetical protein